MKELLARFKMESPKFFKKVQAFGGWLTASCAAIKLASTQFTDSKILGWIDPYLIEGAVLGIVIAILAKMPVSDVDELKKKLGK